MKVLLLALLPTFAFASKGEVSAPPQKMSASLKGAPEKSAPATDKRQLRLDFKKSS